MELCELRHCLEELCRKGAACLMANRRPSPFVRGQALQRDASFPRAGSVQVLPPSSSCRRIHSAVLPIGVGSDARRVVLHGDRHASARNINTALSGMFASPAARALSRPLGRCLPTSRAASREDSTTLRGGEDAISATASSPSRPGPRSPRRFGAEPQAFCSAAPPRLQQDPQYLQSLASTHCFPSPPQPALSATVGHTQLAVGATPVCSSRGVGRGSSPSRASPGIESVQKPPLMQLPQHMQPPPRSSLVPHSWALHANRSRRMSLSSLPQTPQVSAWSPGQGHGVIASLDLRNVTRSPALSSLSREVRVASSPVTVPEDRH